MTFASENKAGALKAFFWALILAAAIYIPLVIYNDGYFLFIGDFNVQQIPFYQLAHEAVKSGNVFWNWHTDLGANFIGSYSFYLLFSPFFWLTLPFPTEFVPHLMAPLLILKTCCAALFAYFYVKRFVKDSDIAAVGAILYAFSGFMTFNIFFNHFHDVCVFFPLLLIALEELVENGRHGFFCLAAALNCMVNYWFFIGEVVFVVIYVFIRIITGGWGCSIKKFMLIAFESALGVLLAAVFLLPSVLAITGNPRTTEESLLTGQLMWIYGYDQRLPAIIQSFFFPPELPSRPHFFPEMGAKWSSLSAWLPLFSSTGVIAFCAAKKKNFHKRIIITSMIMALVPIFNSAFVLFNSSYYARWFYMPVLMMSTVTASALEQRSEPEVAAGWKCGWNWCAGFILIMSAAIAFSPVYDKAEKSYSFGLYGDKAGFWLLVFVALVCLLFSAALMFLFSDSRFFKPILCAMLSFVVVAFTLGYLCSGKNSKTYDDWFIQTVIEGKIDLPEDDFARSDFYECSDNLGMYWGLPNIQAFHSIVPPSIMEFYPSVGIKRDVSSKPSIEYDSLRSLLSVKWLFIGENEENQQPMPYFTLYDNQLGYNIYENEHYIPMGFVYDKAITDENVDKLSGEQKVRHMLNAVELSDAAIVRNFDIIKELTEPDFSSLSRQRFSKIIEEKQQNCCDSFTIDNRGFTAVSSFEKDSLVFFSVPYDKGWSATVNGSPAVIEKANVGFMAVRAPSGDAVIRFDYVAPGLIFGAKVSAVAAAVLVVYLLISKLFAQKTPKAVIAAPAEPKADTTTSADKEAIQSYLETLSSLPLIDEKSPNINPEENK